MRTLPLLLSLIFTSNVVAQEVQMTGTIDPALHVPQSTLINEPTQQESQPHIKILKIQLSNHTIPKRNKQTNTAIKKLHNLNGVYLVNFDLGALGAAGSHKANFDTLVLASDFSGNSDSRSPSGSPEMMITGYDDDAIAIDDQGNQHKGLFTLKNSKSESSEDKETFYMSYDYFDVFLRKVHRVHILPSANENPDITTA